MHFIRRPLTISHGKVRILSKLQQAGTTAQKKKFSIKDFFNKCDQIRIFLCSERLTNLYNDMNPSLIAKRLNVNYLLRVNQWNRPFVNLKKDTKLI